MSACPSCGMPGYPKGCPVCMGDFEQAMADGLIDPREYIPEPEPEPTVEDYCASYGHQPYPQNGYRCYCGEVRYVIGVT